MATGYPRLSILNPGIYLQNVSIPKTGGGFWPHLVDFLIPLVTIKHVVIGLHGGGGGKSSYPRQLVLSTKNPATRDSINWPVLSYWGVMIVIPQGQACEGVDPTLGAGMNPWNPNDANTISANNPQGVATWSNEFMWSSANDPAFLVDLVAYIAATYPGYTTLNIGGHSNGGFMAFRMWHEQPTLFDHYLCTSGPPSNYYASVTPTGGVYKPVWMQFGEIDNVLDISGGPAGAGDHFYDSTWEQNPAQLSVADVAFPAPSYTMGGWHFAQKAVAGMGDPALAGPGTPLTVAIGTAAQWTSASGKVVIRLLSNAGHPAWQQQQCLGHVGGRYFGRWMQFITTT